MRSLFDYLHKLEELIYAIVNIDAVEQTRSIQRIPPLAANKSTLGPLFEIKMDEHFLQYF
jgi:hypothetical protein